MPDAGVAGPGNTTATVCTQIGCPPHTGHANCSMATVCTQIGCHTAPQHCIPTIPPLCPPHTGPNGTVATVCTQIGCPSFGFTCTAFCQAQEGGGGSTAATTCTQIGCAGGVDTVHAAALAGPGNTAATLCTQIGCHTFGFTCTAFCQGAGGGLQGAAPEGGGAGAAASTSLGMCGTLAAPQQGGNTTATVCTQFGCVPRTRKCPPTFQPGCGPDHEHGGSTAATLCTLTPFCPPTAHCPGHTLATLCTQIGCQPHTGLGCLRTSTCPPTQAPGCGGGGIRPSYGPWCAGGGGLRAEAPGAEGAAAPTTIYGPQCPTFGFTCTYVHCPPVTGFVCPPPTAGLGCPPTSTCPPVTVGLGCPPTSTCPPVTVGLGCPSTSTCPPPTAGCPNTSGCPISADCPPPTGACPPA